MSRYLAILETNDELLQNSEDGSLEKALSWCCDSGVRLKDYIEISDDYKLIV